MKTFVTGAALALPLACAAPAAGDPIQIIGGSLVYQGFHRFSPLTLQGEGGFSFGGNPGLGLFDPEDCVVPTCVSGRPVSLLARWVGTDLGGTAILNGITYGQVGSLSSNTSMFAEFGGVIFAPPSTSGGWVILRAPFTFAGRFFVGSFPESTTYELLGEGVATASFLRHDGTDAWRIDRLEYQFTDASTAPEPSTLALVALGAAAGAWRSRKRRKTSPRL